MKVAQLLLDQTRTQRLLSYITAYRRVLLQQPPSPGRNTTQRVLQALQGRLIQEGEQAQTPCLFLLDQEEVTALKTLVTFSLRITTKEPQTEPMREAMVELAGLKGVLDRLHSVEQQKQYTPGPF